MKYGKKLCDIDFDDANQIIDYLISHTTDDLLDLLNNSSSDYEKNEIIELLKTQTSIKEIFEVSNIDIDFNSILEKFRGGDILPYVKDWYSGVDIDFYDDISVLLCIDSIVDLLLDFNDHQWSDNEKTELYSILFSPFFINNKISELSEFPFLLDKLSFDGLQTISKKQQLMQLAEILLYYKSINDSINFYSQIFEKLGIPYNNIFFLKKLKIEISKKIKELEKSNL